MYNEISLHTRIANIKCKHTHATTLVMPKNIMLSEKNQP